MIQGQDIICLSSIDWDFNWQGHQEIMSTFAQHGNRVLYVENTGVRMPTVRDLPRLRRRLQAWWGSLRGFRQVQERLWVYAPLILPFPYARAVRWFNRRLLLGAIRRWMRAAGVRDPIIWTFLPTGVALDVINALDHKLAVYYCIADFEQLVSHPEKIRRTEREVVRRCDLVFAQGEVLKAKCERDNASVHVFPFGVKLEVFEPQRLAAGLPEEFTQLPRPIIGYVGGLHRHMDFELLRCVAGRRPEWTFTLIGPEQADVSALRALPNIRLLGGRAIEALPRYINAFDVGIIPYVESAYTRTVYPTKLNEYHALGKPVVSTPLPEVQAFNERHGGLVYLGGTPDEFEAQLERALAQRNGELAQRRIAVARENAWSERIAQMSCLMEERMAERAAAAPQRWRERFLAASESARRRLTWIVATVALSYLGVFYTPVLWWVAEPLRISEAPEISDAIVVFAGGVGESGRAGQGYEERVAWAVDLYRRGYAPRLIFSSGYTYRFHETEVMAALARALGVPDSAIWLEAAGSNTLDNVRLTGGLMRQQGWRSALLVSSPYHMRRAALVWRRLAPELRLRCVPIRESLFYTRGAPRASGLRRQATPTQVQAIAHEYLSLLYYWLKGRL